MDEGASQIHIHARTPEGVPSYEIEDFRAITEAILAEVDDVIVNYSTGAIGVPVAKRIEYLRELRPDVAALNMSSMNYAKYSARRKDFVFKAVFENSFDTIIEFLTAMRELGIKPEHECFDAGHIANLDPLIDMGLLSEPLNVSLVIGVNGGIRPNARNVAFMAEQIPGGAEGPNNWQVIGISRDQWRLVGAALALGGNVRAGLEDNFYLPNGEMARSNGDLIAKARQMAEDVGRRAATVAEARELLGVPEAGREWLASELPLSDVRGARPDPAAAGRLLLAAARRPGRRRGQGRGHRHGRLRALGAALLRLRAAAGAGHPLGALPGAQPRQALDPRRSEVAWRPRGVPAPRRRVRRRARGLPARRPRQARLRLRGAASRPTPASSTARSPAMGRRAPTRSGPGTT